MGFLSKRIDQKSKRLAEPRPLKDDTIFRLLRILTSRIVNIETQVSTLRRDVNRIDRKQLREAEIPSLAKLQPIPGNGPGAEALEVIIDKMLKDGGVR